ncbi:MAG: hypothetical protein JXR96_14885 [Deltaproteobacteria bacterium]|nr:hypothetical protein [Deltaproteobacteria bacterium]
MEDVDMKMKWVWLSLIALALACSPASDLPGPGTDGGDQCPVICSTSDDCCASQICIGGVCTDPTPCPSGCHSECEPGQSCNRTTHVCESQPISGSCYDDCDCYAHQTCREGVCVSDCTSDADCAGGKVCQDGACVPAACSSREDCAGEECLVCRDGQCLPPLEVCMGDQDCCVGKHCNFGACVPDSQPCESDEDCTNPDLPVCLDGKCAAAGTECRVDGDCLADQVCQNGVCVTTGCAATGCGAGQYCDQASGECKPGCGSNDDCEPPATCDYGSHQCVVVDCCGGVCDPDSQRCDPGTCQCFTPCTETSCAEGSHCNQLTGHCEPDAFDCNRDGCSAGYVCNTETGQCELAPFDCNVDGCSAGYECDELSGQCVPVQAECGPDGFTSSIMCGGSTSGAFEPGCESTQRSGSYAKQYIFYSTAGTQVTIDLVSDEDTYLYLLDYSGNVLSSDDDGGASLDSQIVYNLPADAAYIIEATTYSAAVTGTFDVLLACAQGSECSSSISCGQVIHGSWTGECEAPDWYGSYGRLYTFEAVDNQDVQISLSSTTVDTYLILLGPDGDVQAYNDDEDLFSTDSYLSGTILVGGTWTIEATTYDYYTTGDFVLELDCP